MNIASLHTITDVIMYPIFASGSVIHIMYTYMRTSSTLWSCLSWSVVHINVTHCTSSACWTWVFWHCTLHCALNQVSRMVRNVCLDWNRVQFLGRTHTLFQNVPTAKPSNSFPRCSICLNPPTPFQKMPCKKPPTSFPKRSLCLIPPTPNQNVQCVKTLQLLSGTFLGLKPSNSYPEVTCAKPLQPFPRMCVKTLQILCVN